MQTIFLIGFMGTGKSTVSGLLAEKLQVQKIEMDEAISSGQNLPITKIFEKFGEEYFRDLEGKTLVELGERGDAVVSCGGGVVVRSENIAYMKANGNVVWLTATPETVFERVKDSDERPVLNGNMNVEYIAALMKKRHDLYRRAADFEVRTDDKTAVEIVDEILQKLREKAGKGESRNSLPLKDV